jgi:hypothetical protein
LFELNKHSSKLIFYVLTAPHAAAFSDTFDGAAAFSDTFDGGAPFSSFDP